MIALPEIVIALNTFPSDLDLSVLWNEAVEPTEDFAYQRMLTRGLCHATVKSHNRLIGFVNVATDGGKHAFLIDPVVHPDFRRRGVATRLVKAVAAEARRQGAVWLHVDYPPELEPFYAGCGFMPTSAGLIRL